MNLRFNHQHKTLLLYFMGGLLCLCMILSLCVGTINLSPIELIQLISYNHPNDNHVTLVTIIEKIRLPRALLAIVIGATLALCGAVAQGLFRNPLADPSLIGVSAGASIGASLTIVLISNLGWTSSFHTSIGISTVSLGAFITALLATLIVYKLSSQRTGTSVATMLLAGIAITAIAGGVTSLLEYISSNEALRRISLWRMGGLDGANFVQVLIMLGLSGFLTLIFCLHSTALNALLLGESEARHLGINIQKVKILFIILIAAGVGVAVSIAGGIGFIGLIVPHIMRLIIGPNHSYLLPASLLAGAILLLLADTVARTILSPVEIPVGIITAFIGAPFFISLLKNRHHYGMQDN